mmetsp:Transcript_35612/g.95557  ORF Transcript_35612/g.95557 Transcript_35612/m.95557 type:complete len:141 (-) Transcript_35612:344-766(-)
MLYRATIPCSLSGRAASMRSGGLVRGRLVIDGRGLGLGTIKHIGLVKSITSLAKAYFPETTASATIIRAPFVFAQIFRLVKPLLTPQQQRKVAIFGEDFESGLKSHAGLDIECLPVCLGGTQPDSQLCRAEPVPVSMYVE